MASIVVWGVHPLGGNDVPCHFLDVELRNLEKPFDLAKLTQPSPGIAAENWQVPYDEVLLDADGRPTTERVPTMLGPGTVRVAFFMHDLDVSEPLHSPFGDVALPPATPRPERLEAVQYEPPD